MEGRALSRPHSVRRGVAATTERGPPPTKAKQSILSAKVNKASFCEIESTYGPDAFLLKNEALEALIQRFLDNLYAEVSGVPSPLPANR
jgi:homoserine acetyltransferase